MSGNDPRDLLQAALGLHGQGRLEGARRLYLQYLGVLPEDPLALFGLGVLCLDMGDMAEAKRRLGHAARLSPGDADVAVALGRAHIELNEFDEALEAFDRAVAINPSDADARNGRGTALTGLCRAEEALEAHGAALVLRPGCADALAGLGNALLALGRFGEAADRLGEANRASPGSPEVLNSLGAAYKALGRLDEAISAFEAALAARPDFSEALANLGSALREMGLTDQAGRTYERAMALAPNPGLALRLALLLPPIMESTAAIDAARHRLAESLRRLDETRPRFADPYAEVGETAFYLAYHGRDDHVLQREVAALHLDACPELAFTAAHCGRARPRRDRIRIGLVSAFFHNHTIGKLFGPLVERLDRRRFEVVLFRLPGFDDARGRALMAAADAAAFVPDSLVLARRAIAEAECDVLFYPDIGMHALGYFLSFARLAPVQCVGFGHPVTTGAPNVDYYLSSEELSPRDGVEGFSEQLVRFSRLPIYYERPAELGRTYRPADFGLPENRRLYVCPQSLFKFHPDFDPALGGILSRDPEAVLVLIQGKHPAWEAALRRRFAGSFEHDPARIVFLPRLSMEDFAGALSVADALLDTFHFGGGNTTLEALALDAPVVTLPGPYLRGRISLACYRQMGLAEPVAASPEDFVAKAVRLANDRDYRAELSRRIAATKSVLFEDGGVVREMEDFFEQVRRDTARH